MAVLQELGIFVSSHCNTFCSSLVHSGVLDMGLYI